MDSFDTQRRRLIDGLLRELVTLASEISSREVTRALAAQREREKAVPKVSPRLARALERAEERRRLAAERRAALAARPASRRTRAAANSESNGGPSARSSRQPAPLMPPPLFVHKRSRDGSIQKLERAATDEAPPPLA